MNPLMIVGAVALFGLLATMGGKAGADEGIIVINGNGGAGNGNGLGQGNGIGNGNGNGNGNGPADWWMNPWIWAAVAGGAWLLMQPQKK